MNSPIGSEFLGSVEASNESTNANNMYNLFEKAIEKLDRKMLYKLSLIMLVRMNVDDMTRAMYPHILLDSMYCSLHQFDAW